MSTSLISFQLSLTQADLVIEALSEQPFKTVFDLIGQLNRQAAAQVDRADSGAQMLSFELEAAQVRIVIEALGEFPYNRVHQLLALMHQQLANQTRLGRGE
ncbi:hypothetical protein RF679_18015 [Undibacterium cyanobacteriorum]|uniref:Uncharacterized protein n=1 Tax=Undibacterium cyanobacteriorum TaxID=3073561 RepID=A0ABY9RH14_9BURK|nr:hypothetical protein [Undibacterium sp. 20NA77.5]WMW80513.1 hypothetical protein RF679_18015 [Undibacterium sp. 20NA77.5]